MIGFVCFILAVSLSGCLTETILSAPECPNPSEDLTYFPATADCSKYYECYRGTSYLMSCPPGTYWNMEKSTCDYAQNIECKVDPEPTTTPVPIIPTGAPDSDCPIDSYQVIFYPHPSDCSKFYECVDGVKYLLTCPAPLHWNQILRACSAPTNAVCAS